MSSLLALRQLGKSVNNITITKNYGHLMKSTSHMTPAQCLATKVNITNQKSPSSSAPSDVVKNNSGNNNDEWRTIYHLPLIRLASAFNRVKVPYGMLNAVTVPAAFALEQASQLPPSTALLIGTVGVTSWCTLAISSLFTRNLIGIIYINDSNDKLKFAYLDYWGKRHDACVELNDLVPEWEKEKPAKFDFYQNIKLYSDDKVNFKLLQRFGSIEDPETFATIFGE